ncbi:small ubiquitin-like modifier 2 [Artemisia annua]|uniref:Small ubiquitin-like modifier 2 n=1 Tax=Artemisia annua TaxID=35608 RepID=A0A2U1L9P2_ARTAN|nr:small ubiquitin-like modifier 2 [Artemisia annua]
MAVIERVKTSIRLKTPHVENQSEESSCFALAVADAVGTCHRIEYGGNWDNDHMSNLPLFTKDPTKRINLLSYKLYDKREQMERKIAKIFGEKGRRYPIVATLLMGNLARSKVAKDAYTKVPFHHPGDDDYQARLKKGSFHVFLIVGMDNTNIGDNEKLNYGWQKHPKPMGKTETRTGWVGFGGGFECDPDLLASGLFCSDLLWSVIDGLLLHRGSTLDLLGFCPAPFRMPSLSSMCDGGDGPVTQEDEKKPMDQGAHINLKVKSQDGNEVFFKIKRITQLKKLMNAYCDRQSVEMNAIAFLFDGRRLRAEQTLMRLLMARAVIRWSPSQVVSFLDNHETGIAQISLACLGGL